ncbi:MAG: hypothetical protein WKF89_13735 [Chitinophagaceae bacterium]
MKKIISALFGLVILLGACKKDDIHPCPPAVKEQAWEKYAGNPVFTKSVNSWDDGIILGHSIIKSGNTFRMWYTGGHSIETFSSIGYATSTDGIHWERYGDKPVFEAKPGSWEQSFVGIPHVLQDGNTLRMWYSGGSNSSPDGGKIGYATSQDGIHWDRHPSPVFQSKAGGWYADGIFPGAVIKENGTFKMWFSGAIGSITQATPTSKTSIGYAISPDGIKWTVYDNPLTTESPYHFSDPVVKHGAPGAWDVTSAFSASVIKTQCGYEMWYAGEIYNVSQNLGYATSPDGIKWTKNPQNPVLTTDPWNILLVFPSVILDKNKYRMWYGGFVFDGESLGGAIGYATMPK